MILISFHPIVLVDLYITLYRDLFVIENLTFWGTNDMNISDKAIIQTFRILRKPQNGAQN